MKKLAEWIEGEFTPTELFKILTADHGLFKVSRIITEEGLWP